MKNNIVSHRMLSLMRAKHLSYGKLSDLTNVPKSALQRYATGETQKLSFDRLEVIAEALGCTASYLLGWDEDNTQMSLADTIYVRLQTDKRFLEIVETLNNLDEEKLNGVQAMLALIK